MKLDADGRYLRDAAVDEVGVICITGPNLFEGTSIRNTIAGFGSCGPAPTEKSSAGSTPEIWARRCEPATFG